MLFNSYEFIFFFLPLTFIIYFYLLNQRLVVGAKGFLVFASLFFYSWWNIVYLPIILSSMLFNYVIGNSLNDNIHHLKVLSREQLKHLRWTIRPAQGPLPWVNIRPGPSLPIYDR